jgi:hypothetical protein
MFVADDYSLHAINIGKCFLLQIIDTCKELENILHIYAYVESTNINGIHFYKMIGFQQKEILQDYFSQRASLTPDAIKLEYRIEISTSNKSSDNSSIILTPNSTIYNVCLCYPKIN